MHKTRTENPRRHIVLFLISPRDVSARVLDLVPDVCQLPRRLRYRVQSRVPRVFRRWIRGEEREVLPPDVAGELRHPLLVAHS